MISSAMKHSILLPGKILLRDHESHTNNHNVLISCWAVCLLTELDVTNGTLCWNEDSLNQCWTSWWYETWCVHLLNTPKCLWTMMLQPLYYMSCVAQSSRPNEKQHNRAFLFISILSPPTISHSQWKPMHIADLQQQDKHIKDNSVPLVTYWDPWRNWANVNKMFFSCYEKEECLLWSYKTILKECQNHFDMTLFS